MAVKVKVNGRGNQRDIVLDGRLVGRIERVVFNAAVRGIEGGKHYTRHVPKTSWRAWDPAGRALGERRSMAAWRRWFAAKAVTS